MTTKYIGTTFPKSFQWHTDEVGLINSIKNQIDIAYPLTKNLFINTTWFGPQFDNGEYGKFLKIAALESFDNLFLLAAADPVFLNSDQITNITSLCGVSNLFLLGHFDTEYYFNFHSIVLPKYFYQYTTDQITMKTPTWKFLNYNRKPRDHRTEFVNKVVSNKLDTIGLITLGNLLTIGEKISDYVEGNWGMPDDYGIPHDIHSLGRMDIWQNHFLTVVSETEFLPWDNMFISEKTWKPILGLRPFVLNGQTKIYKYLRDNGFKTFNHYFNGIELEDIPEYEVHDSIISVIKYLATLDKTEILTMYNNMLPELVHNRNRFFEFAKEQQYKIDHLFE
tara:strand:+ start:956 stop:1963 length:1008 start_codon:yes stop_codon:yes gene_type:complete